MGSTDNPSIDLFDLFSTTVFNDNTSYSSSTNPSSDSSLVKQNRIRQRLENSDTNIFSNRDIGDEYDISITQSQNFNK